MNAGVYYRSYNRALLKYANNAFLSRYLDADDIAFIESIRERGCIGAPYSDAVVPRAALLEEMEFWHKPYAASPYHATRLGPPPRPPRPPPTPAALQRQSHKDLLAREAKAERERLYQKQLEQLRRDLEWEKAAPPLPFGQVRGRHFIPQWQLDEERASERVRKAQRALVKRRAKKRAAPKLRARQEAEAARQHRRQIENAAAAAKAERRQQRELAQRAAAQQREQAAAIEEAQRAAAQRAAAQRAAVEEAKRAARQAAAVAAEATRRAVAWQNPPAALSAFTTIQIRSAERAAAQVAMSAHNARPTLGRPTLAQQHSAEARSRIKKSIAAVLLQRYPSPVTLENLVYAIGCPDFKFVQSCLEELLAEQASNAKADPHWAK